MALNGDSGWIGFGNSNTFGLRVTWSAMQSVSGNYSDVTVTYQMRSTSSGSYFDYTSNAGLQINGTSYDRINERIVLNPNATITLKTQKVRVNHNSDGTKSFSIFFNFSNPVTGSSGTKSTDVNLNKIARAYTFITSSSNAVMDSNFTVKIDNNGSGFSAKLYAWFGNKKLLVNGSMPIGSNYDFVFKSSDFADQIPNSAIGIGNLEVETWSGSTKIGNAVKGITLTVPPNITPTISNITYADTNNTVTNITGSNQILVQNKSVLQLTTTANGIYGSTIKEYNVSIGGLSFTSASNVQTIDLSQYSIGTGSIVATVTVTDSRGRKTSMDVMLNVQAYSPPMLKNFKVTRNIDLNTTINIVKSVAVSSIKNGTTEKNSYTVVTKYKKTVDTAWITAKTETNTSANFALTGMAIESSYDVQVTITDKLSAPVPVKSSVPSIFMIMSWSATTVGIGKAAEQGVLDIAGKLSDIYVGGISLLDLVYPIGEIKTTTNSQNPSATIGGTWERYGKGRVPVGLDESDGDFDTVGKTGGEKAHTLTTNEIAHNHNQTTSFSSPYGEGIGYQYTIGGSVAKNTIKTSGVVDVISQAHNNLQPYITVYLWRRIA